MKMNGKHVRKYFLEWLEDDLNSERKKEINQHLKQCESCQSYYQAMQRVMVEPNRERLPYLEKDPYLPVRIKQKVKNNAKKDAIPMLGFSKKVAGSLVVFGLLIGFLMGQLLVYNSQKDQEVLKNRSVTELFYEGMVQSNLGSNFEQVLTEMKGDQQ